MTKTRKSRKTKGVLRAELTEEVNIGVGGHSEVCLEIQAENLTQKTILLDKNYYIPLDEAFDIEAYDLNNEASLQVFYNRLRKRIEVVFKRGTRLAPNQKFSWSVNFKTTRFGKNLNNGDFMTGLFSLVPAKSYKQIPIQNHRVQLRFAFLRPKEGESIKEVEVHESNSLHVPSETRVLPDRVVCRFETFDLSRGSEMKITFHYQYRFPAPVSLEKTSRTWDLRHYGRRIFSVVQQVPSVIVTNLVKDTAPLVLRKGLGLLARLVF